MTSAEKCPSLRILSTRDAAAYCGISRQTLYNLNSQGRGPFYFKQGKRNAFYERDLDEWNRAVLLPSVATRQPMAKTGQMETNRIEFPPALMTRELAAYYLSVSTRELDLMKNRGDITAYGEGKRIRFKKTDLDRWVELLPERH